MKIKTRHIILTLFVLYLSVFRISGQTRTDSLESLFADASDYIKILILGELIDEYAAISLEKSLEYANQSLEIGLRKNNQRWIADSYNKIGNIYSRVEMFSEALQYYLDETEIREQLLDTTGMENSYFNLGLNYFNMGDTIHSLQYYHKSLKIAKLKSDSLKCGIRYKNIAEVYLKAMRFDKALDYYNQSLEFLNQANDHYNRMIVLTSIGTIKRKSEEYALARNYFFQALKIALAHDFKPEMTRIAYIAGNTFMDEGNLFLAQNHFNEALSLAKEEDYLDIIADLDVALSKLYVEKGNYKKALFLQKEAFHLKDTLRRMNQENKLSFLEMKYDYDRKKNELDILKRKNEIRVAEIGRQKRLEFLAFIVFGVLSITVVISSRIYIHKRKLFKTLKEKMRELQKVQKELLRSESNLKNMGNTKNKLFSVLAHDLINPFNALLGFASLLNEESHRLNKSEINQYSNIIYQAATDTFQLLENLLQWSRSQTGQIVTKKEDIDINKIVLDVLSNVKVLAEKKEIQVKTELSEDCVAFADPNLLSSALRNIVQNAIKFIDKGNEIRIKTDRKNGKIIVVVSDTGRGISPEDQEKLFRTDLHFTTKGTSNERGTGLGLIIAKEFVELNDGYIDMESQVGKGSNFNIILPANKPKN